MSPDPFSLLTFSLYDRLRMEKGEGRGSDYHAGDTGFGTHKILPALQIYNFFLLKISTINASNINNLASGGNLDSPPLFYHRKIKVGFRENKDMGKA